MPSKKLTLKQIYKDFGLRYDVREARKLLDLEKNVSKKEVNQLLRDYWYEIEDETNPYVYVYTLSGTSRTTYTTKATETRPGTLNTLLTQPQNISLQFQSTTKIKVPLRKFATSNVLGVDTLPNQFPIITIQEALNYLPNERIIESFINKGTGSERFTTFEYLTRQRVRKTQADIRTTQMFKSYTLLPYKEFNGFKDSGNSMCVPETILHHLQLNNRNKKLKLNDIVDTLEKYAKDDEDTQMCVSYRFREEELEGQYECECPDEFTNVAERGYTPEELIKTLEDYNCRARLLDVNLKEFISTNNYDGKKFDKHLKSFLGICYGNHLYYCDDIEFVKQISAKMNYEKSDNFFEFDAYDKCKSKNHHAVEREYEIIETPDLTDLYINLFEEDNTLKKVRLQDGKIVSITQGNKVICANPEKSMMEEILGSEFKNENTTILGLLELKEYLPQHNTHTHMCELPMSNFNKEVFDAISKHGNIVKTYKDHTLCKVQAHYDINKCRTDCIMNNRLGDYELYNVSCDIKPYSGKLSKGMYYIETADRDFFMRGNSWYSSDYLKYAKKEKIKFTVRYELIASSSLGADYFKKFIIYITEKYPNHYKHIVNKMIGMFGKTHSKVKSGYIEPNFDLAVAYFWDNNEEGIGFNGDVNVDKNIWKNLKGKNCNIDTMYLRDGTKHYKVETTEYKTLYQNNMPIYNKILENEYIRLYELKKRVGGTLIQIKTDAIIVEGDYNRIKCDTKIGGIKYTQCCADNLYIKEEERKNDIGMYTLDTDISWNIYKENEDYTTKASEISGSYLITGLAGYGKSHLVKSLPEYDLDTTIRLGFTNVSTENLADEDHISNTLNSYFGIDFTNGKCSEKKMKKLRNVKCIIITEIFMCPSYIMSYLDKIKIAFPDIKWIVEGDPEQLRPVKEEHINWLNSKMFNKLCDGNLIKLVYNKRNDETKNYNKILNCHCHTGMPLDKERYVYRPPQSINICRTNQMRVKINDMCMDKENFCKFIEAGEGDKEQDIYLKFDTPIMCIKNNKKLNIKNGSTSFICTSFDDKHVYVNDIQFTDAEFMKHFVVAYAMTNHKVQGITIRQPYNIYEWNKMETRARYTAYSRTADAELVRIIN